jgi:glycosyltransferase involved in cell wall biosynthesis
MLYVDIGMFAHNQDQIIEGTIRGLARQDIFRRKDVSVQVFILANGCVDETAKVARSVVETLDCAHQIQVLDLKKGGKSRTWNVFVHEISRPEADQLIFCDADIEIPNADMLYRLSHILADRSDLSAASSLPVKDTVYRPGGLTPTDRLIVAGAGTLNSWKHAISGQLYTTRASVARSFHLPIGVAVEDGFVRAMVVTRVFSAPENLNLIDGEDDIFHVYASERSVSALVRHQVKIVIGSAVNAAVFSHLRDQPDGAIGRTLAQAARDENWVSNVLRKKLPTWPYGWVPFHFLTKRMNFFKETTSDVTWKKVLFVVCVGVVFDAIVYVTAQIKMARGVGAGYW